MVRQGRLRPKLLPQNQVATHQLSGNLLEFFSEEMNKATGGSQDKLNGEGDLPVSPPIWGDTEL